MTHSGMKTLVLFGAALLTSAQHHHGGGTDPFAHSGCNCSAFCDGQCAINATGPQQITLYRMTPQHTLTLDDKNTGDVAGDTSYIISRRTAAFDCRNAPANDTHCASMTVTGDVANSTDLIIEFELEVDGNWGPCVEPLSARRLALFSRSPAVPALILPARCALSRLPFGSQVPFLQPARRKAPGGHVDLQHDSRLGQQLHLRMSPCVPSRRPYESHIFLRPQWRQQPSGRWHVVLHLALR